MKINELQNVTFVTCFFAVSWQNGTFLENSSIEEKNPYAKNENKTRFSAADCQKSGYKGYILIINELRFWVFDG